MAQSNVKYQEMYKCRTPPWKENYRKRCLERLRENRAKIQSKHRPTLNAEQGQVGERESCMNIQDIMMTEWTHMQTESPFRKRPGFEEKGKVEFCEEQPIYITELVSLYEEIEKELLLEEQRLLSVQDVCDDHIQKEEDLCSALQALSTDQVICPLCEKNCLLENKGVIVCHCGLRINTEQDCLNLKYIHASLQAGMEEHGAQCEAKPTFSQSLSFGVSSLIMSCQICNFLFVVI